jgi:mono/diheme cytochrome c family protein
LQKVVQFYREKKLDEMNKLIGEIESTIGSLQAGGTLTEPVLAPFKARLAAAQKLSAHALIATTASSTPAPGAPKPTGTRPGRPTAPMPAGGTGVDFARDVVPIFVAKCGNCHVRGNRGDFNMGTYAMLMAGTQGNLAVIKPGKGATSTIVEKMESGEMPPGGNKVTQQELATIIKWIDEGAKFAGDPQGSLLALAPGAAGGPNGMPVVARAGANDKVQFMRDVAPILIDNCFNCHGSAQGNNNSGNFGMYTFAQLMRGGQDGPVVAAGNPDGSVFVQMLRGTAKGQDGSPRPKMPRNGELDQAEMDAIVTWIRDGAKFDGEDANMSIELAWRIAMAKKATHEELKAQRLTTAQKNWKTANPDSPGETIETDDFVFIGNVGSARMSEIVKLAEGEKAKLVTSLKIPTDKPLMKGRLTMFVFDKGFEHKEFGRVVENRELQGGNSHWFFNHIDAYACVVAPSDKVDAMAPLLAETIVGAYLDSCGPEMPRWFAVGTARNIASKMHPNSVVGKQWEDALASAFSSGIKPDAIMTTTNLDAGTAALSQAFVKDLMRAPSWSGLLSNLRSGARFEGAFNTAFRSAPLPLFGNWLRSKGG